MFQNRAKDIAQETWWRLIEQQRAGRLQQLLLPGLGVAQAAFFSLESARREEVALVQKRLSGTHWKRKLPTVAMLSGTAIGEAYLRPVDY